MKTLLFLSCTVTVVLGFAPNRLVQRDLVPAQGHVVQEDFKPMTLKRTELLKKTEQDTNTEVVPLVQEEEAVVPMVQEEEAVVPLVQEEEAVVPLVQEEEAVVPLVQEEEAVVPLVQEEEAVVPLVQEEEMNAVPKKEVDPEMGVEGGQEGAEAEASPILEKEFLVVEEPSMELEPLEEKSLIGQDLTNDELLPADFQYELKEEPITELEPLEEKSLIGQDLTNDELLPADFQYELKEEPITELEPLEEKSLIGQDLTNDELLPADFQYELKEEPIMELEPLSKEVLGMDSEPNVMVEEPIMEMEPFGYHPIMSYNDIMIEEPIMELEPEMTDRLSVMVEEPMIESPLAGEKFLQENSSPMKRGTPEVGRPLLFEQPIVGEGPMMDGAAHVLVEPVMKRRSLEEEGGANHPQVETSITGRRSCPSVILGGKCYQFFKGPKKAADAEFFCQRSFPQGHLASITSRQVHRHLMDLMFQQIGHYTRTWVGGLRYLETGRFIWLDGAHWTYDDFLPGEPNNTMGVEDCIELLAVGNGKFNDMPCWDLRAFICSFPV